MTKQELRKMLKSQRAVLNEQEMHVYSHSLALRFEMLLSESIKNVHLFLPIKNQKEVDTGFILDLLIQRNINCIISKTNIDEGTLTHYLFDDDTDIEVNIWGIPEPVNGKEVSEEDIDLVIVPLLGCDVKGNRIGYGKGFYDRFLEKCRPDCLKVGVGFFPPLKEIPAEKHDIALDHYLSPSRSYHFNP